MTEYATDDFLSSPTESIKIFSEIKSNTDKVITTPNGVTVIPISKIAMGYATGGVGLKESRTHDSKNIGGGGGTGIVITPLAFLTVGQSGEINLISLNDSDNTVEKIINFAEHAPEIIEKIKGTIS